LRSRLGLAEMSVGHGGQADNTIIAERGDGFQCHIAGALDGPFVVLLQQNGSHQAEDGLFIGEDADDIGASFDLAIEAFQAAGGMQLGPVRGGEDHVGQHIGLGLVHRCGQFR